MPYRVLKWKPEYAADAGFAPDPRALRVGGLPTVFDDDQRPVADVNHWLLGLASSHSPDTWETYAREVVRLAAHFEEEFGVGLLADEVLLDGDEMLRTYQLKCTGVDQEDRSADPVGDAASTIGKRRAAITSFYRWAVRARRITELPFSTKTVQTRWGPVEVVAGLDGGRRSRSEREPIPSDQQERFLRVGLLGELPDGGGPDPTFQGYLTAQRNAAGVGLGLAAGLRHSEVLAFTIFELPPPHPDGFTPLAVADQTAKNDSGRRAIAFSDWLRPVHAYVRGDRRNIARNATWRPQRPLEVVVERTNRREVTFCVDSRQRTEKWNDLDLAARRRLVLPGGGSPLVLLNHRTANGAPLTNPTALNEALALAGSRCAALWGDLHWSYSMHHLRHTYATALTRFLAARREHIAAFVAAHGRRPVWAELVTHENTGLLVQESLGHAGPDTTLIYQHAALWDLLLSVNADPQHNPALREEVG
ncbi:hypothetical protein [Blastococcus sp. TF02A-30]|uniref:hypothetical protein n=1 Tax=Blastococcus sp. TF02A-30 TaxID=2250580 RepID=UPI000DEA0739|nr:hypothetical protein [Blastococcus sp. TF02A-30]RBY86445.1 hypothetical protein DQ241_12990 [Blastococcus sp. TF02A-30]